MKTLQITFLVLICFGFCSFILAQAKPTALKFDEFTEDSFKSYSPEKISFNSRVIRFAQEVLKNKNSKAYIISYNQRKGKFPLNKGDEWNKDAFEIITGTPYSWRNPNYQVSSEKVFSINGGYRENAAIEFWLVPPDAEFPKPTPTFDKSEIAVCPEIGVAGDGFRRDRDLPLNFSVAIKGEEPNAKLDFEWNITAGKIIAGQGTRQIKIDLSETDAKQITASVQIKGLNPECDNHSFNTTKPGSYPYKIDEFYFELYSALAARMDGLFTELAAEPSMTACIIVYGRREGHSREVAKIISDIRKTIAFRRYDMSRVTMIEGGFREEGMIEFYLLPQGAAPPEPTPTVDKKFVVFTDKIKKKPSRRK